MTAVTKTCGKCGACKPRAEFYTSNSNADGLMGACKVCHAGRVAEWQRANKSRVLGYKASWRESNRDRHNKSSAKRYADQHERLKAINRKNAARYCRDLEDQYVRNKLRRGTQLGSADIPQPLVEAKRLQLQIKRLVKKVTAK